MRIKWVNILMAFRILSGPECGAIRLRFYYSLNLECKYLFSMNEKSALIKSNIEGNILYISYK